MADFADDRRRDFEGAREGGIVFEVEGLDEAAQEVVRVVVFIFGVQEDVILTIVRGWVRRGEMRRVYGVYRRGRRGCMAPGCGMDGEYCAGGVWKSTQEGLFNI